VRGRFTAEGQDHLNTVPLTKSAGAHGSPADLTTSLGPMKVSQLAWYCGAAPWLLPAPGSCVYFAPGRRVAWGANVS
jgi:hypothetical protein